MAKLWEVTYMQRDPMGRIYASGSEYVLASTEGRARMFFHEEGPAIHGEEIELQIKDVNLISQRVLGGDG